MDSGTTEVMYEKNPTLQVPEPFHGLLVFPTFHDILVAGEGGRQLDKQREKDQHKRGLERSKEGEKVTDDQGSCKV